MGYCGCGTKSNKSRWFIILALLVSAVTLFIAWSTYMGTCDICEKDTDDCAEEGRTFDFIFDQKQEAAAEGESTVTLELQNCSLGLLRAMFWLAEIAMLAIIVLLCVMCCCANPPYHKNQTTIVP